MAGSQKSTYAVDGATTRLGHDVWVREEPHFAPERTGNTVTAFIDGKDAMADMAASMRDEEVQYIYIADWAFTPTIRLVRDGALKTIKYYAKSGEKLSDIARAHHTTVSEIRRLNPYELNQNQTINVSDRYQGKKGESLSKIAIAIHTTPAEIRRLTPKIDLNGGDELANYQEIFIPSQYHGKKGERLTEIAHARRSSVKTILDLNPDIDLLNPFDTLFSDQMLFVPYDPDTLLYILAERAKAGVQVRVLLWDSADKFHIQDNHDIEAEAVLEDAHKNIRVLRDARSTLWSHHQKFVIIHGAKGSVAYLGGVDLCRGRWDDHTHPVVADPTYHEGDDFYNTRLETPDQPFYQEELDYHRDTRQPWHDVHLRIEGPATFDIETNFAQRWEDERLWENKLTSNPTMTQDNSGKQKVQILRSINSESVDMKGTERSVYHAYLNAIRGAQHFIYIENQFFISYFGSAEVENRIMEALVERVVIAIERNEQFKIVIVIPAHPEGSYFVDTIKGVLDFEFKTLGQPLGVLRRDKHNNEPNGLINRIVNELIDQQGKPEEEAWELLKKYIGIYCLRNHGMLNGQAVHDQIYVHTKTMIVDDRIAIVCSANINDRSMTGGRDTEIAALVEDSNKVEIEIGGKRTLVRKFAHELRTKLWAEHLGIESGDESIKDPYDGFDALKKQADTNTDIYEAVFSDMPSDKIHTLSDHLQMLNKDPRNPGQLSKIVGHITRFPLGWLALESLTYWYEKAVAENETPPAPGQPVIRMT